MGNDFFLTIIFMSFWLVTVGKINLEIIVFGCLVSTGVLFFNKRMNNKSFKKHGDYYTLFKKISLYIFILCSEIIKANFQVAKIVLSPRMKITPRMVHVKIRIKSEFAKVVLANSITLTPGTLTVEVQDEGLIVHSLLEDYIEGVQNSRFEKILLEIEEILC